MFQITSLRQRNSQLFITLEYVTAAPSVSTPELETMASTPCYDRETPVDDSALMESMADIDDPSCSWLADNLINIDPI